MSSSDARVPLRRTSRPALAFSTQNVPLTVVQSPQSNVVEHHTRHDPLLHQRIDVAAVSRTHVPQTVAGRVISVATHSPHTFQHHTAPPPPPTPSATNLRCYHSIWIHDGTGIQCILIRVPIVDPSSPATLATIIAVDGLVLGDIVVCTASNWISCNKTHIPEPLSFFVSTTKLVIDLTKPETLGCTDNVIVLNNSMDNLVQVPSILTYLQHKTSPSTVFDTDVGTFENSIHTLDQLSTSCKACAAPQFPGTVSIATVDDISKPMYFPDGTARCRITLVDKSGMMQLCLWNLQCKWLANIKESSLLIIFNPLLKLYKGTPQISLTEYSFLEVLSDDMNTDFMRKLTSHYASRLTQTTLDLFLKKRVQSIDIANKNVCDDYTAQDEEEYES